jgi:hypothetical protein
MQIRIQRSLLMMGGTRVDFEASWFVAVLGASSHA